MCQTGYILVRNKSLSWENSQVLPYLHPDDSVSMSILLSACCLHSFELLVPQVTGLRLFLTLVV